MNPVASGRQQVQYRSPSPAPAHGHGPRESRNLYRLETHGLCANERPRPRLPRFHLVPSPCCATRSRPRSPGSFCASQHPSADRPPQGGSDYCACSKVGVERSLIHPNANNAGPIANSTIVGRYLLILRSCHRGRTGFHSSSRANARSSSAAVAGFTISLRWM